MSSLFECCVFLVLLLILVIEFIWIFSGFCYAKTQLQETTSFLLEEPNKNYQHLQHLQHLAFATNRAETSVNILDPDLYYLDRDSSELKQAKGKPQRSQCP